MSSLDLNRITHPLRLAKGSHQRGSGKGCAMNVISYINGDVEITDYPSCSARPLAADAARITFTAWAIRRWRELAGLDARDIDTEAVDHALAQIAE